MQNLKILNIRMHKMSQLTSLNLNDHEVYLQGEDT
jgi:hypothetical protein